MTEVKKHSDFFGDKEGLRRSSPVEVAEYKAKRLSKYTIADLGTGIGVQLVQFALHSPEVLGVDFDAKYIEYTRMNLEKYNIKNAKLIKGDALDSRIMKEARKYDVINSDPSRSKNGPNWSLYDLSPNPREILRKYQKDNVTFDLPLRIPKNELTGDPELEYISFGGEPKRLFVYYGELKQRNLSAVSLPSGERITKDESENEGNMKRAEKPLTYVYDLDQVLDISGLLGTFLDKEDELFILERGKQRLLATSEKSVDSSFIIGEYKVIKDYRSLVDLRKDLLNYDYGRIYLRFNIDPNHYYKIKKDLEYNALGLEDIFIFKFGQNYYTATKT